MATQDNGAPERSIYLIGFMGAGKSTVGPHLAALLALPFHDLDHCITESEGRDPATIIETEGEAVFRRVEPRVLRLIPAPAVVALGGGAFLTPRVREHARATGISIFMEWPLEIMLARIRDQDNRPLAKDGRGLGDLYQTRLSIYRQADLIWRSRAPHQLGPGAVACELVDLIHGLHPGGSRTG